MAELSSLLGRTGEWLRGTGPDGDIVISSRVRLARNVANFSFQSRLSAEERQELVELLRDSLAACLDPGEYQYLALDELGRWTAPSWWNAISSAGSTPRPRGDGPCPSPPTRSRA